MEYEVYEENDSSWIIWKRIITTILLNKLRLIISWIIVTILAALAILFVYNREKGVYISTYEWSISSLTNEKYIDGSRFNYKDLISITTLEDVKASNEAFKNIDVRKMYNSDDILIEKKIIVNELTGENEEHYTITVGSKYFKDKDTAREFVEAITNIPVKKTVLLLDVVDYSTNLKLSDGSNVFDTKIDYLQNQYEYLVSKYNQLLTSYGDVYLEDGLKVSDKLGSLKVYFTNNSIDRLLYEVQQNGYILNDSSYAQYLKLRKESLRQSYELNTAKINDLMAQRDDLITKASGNLQDVQLDSYNARIIELTDLNYDIKDEYNIINRKLKMGDPIATGQEDPNLVKYSSSYDVKLSNFTETVSIYTEKLYTFTDEYEEVEKYVESLNAVVYYSTNKVVEAEGGIGLILTALISLAAGLVVSCFINLCFDWKKTKDVEEITSLQENNTKSE